MYIHISNLNKDVTKADILNSLKMFVSVGACAIYHVRDVKTREANTYAMVEMASFTELAAAIKMLNRLTFGGRKAVARLGR